MRIRHFFWALLLVVSGINTSFGQSIIEVNSISENGIYGIGDTVRVQLNCSDTVIVTGMPILELDNGNSSSVATYDLGSGTGSLLFMYIISEGDNTTNLTYTVNGLQLNGGTITNQDSSAAASLMLPSIGSGNALGDSTLIYIDGIRPEIQIHRSDYTVQTDSLYRGLEQDTLWITITDNVGLDTASSPTISLIRQSDSYVLEGPITLDTVAGIDSVWYYVWTVSDDVLDDGLYIPEVCFADLAGNANRGVMGDTIYVVDNTSPSIDTDTLLSPLITNQSSLTWEISFDEEVCNFDTQYLSVIVLDDPINGKPIGDNIEIHTVVPTGDGLGYVITLQNISGDGRVSISLSDSVVQDVAGNYFVGTFHLDTAIIDNTPPSVSIHQTYPTPTVNNSDSVVFTITFSETYGNIQSFEDTDIEVNSGSLLTDPPFITSIQKDEHIVSITGISGSDSLRLTLLAGSVQDTAGNSLAASITSDAYLIDQKRPTVVISKAEPDAYYKGDDVEVITASFSDNYNLDTTLVPMLSFESTTGGALLFGPTVMTAISGVDTAWEYTWTVPTDQASDGTYQPVIEYYDAADNRNQSPSGALVYVVDNTAPRISSIVKVSDNVTNDSSITWRVTFEELNEEILDFTQEDIQWDVRNDTRIGGTLQSNITAQAPISTGIRNQYTITLDSLIGDGFVDLLFTDSIVRDVAGNYFQGAVKSDSIIIDQTSPEAALSLIIENDIPTNANTVRYSLIFNEINGVVENVSTDDFTYSSGGLNRGDLFFSFEDGNQYEISVPNLAGNDSLGVILQISDIMDEAGNPLASTIASPKFLIDNDSPTVVLSRSPQLITPDSIYRFGETDTIVARFSDNYNIDPDSVPTIAFRGQDGVSDLFGPVQMSPHNGEKNAWQYIWAVPISAQFDGKYIAEIIHYDEAGNTNTLALGDTIFIVDNTPPRISGFTQISVSPTNADSLIWQVVFDEKHGRVLGFDKTDLNLIATPDTREDIGNQTSPLIQFEEVVDIGDSITDKYLVILDSIRDEDAFLSFSIGVGAFYDLAGNMSIESYEVDSVIVDNTQPTIASFELVQGSLTNSNEIRFRLTFSDINIQMAGVDTSDFVEDVKDTITFDAKYVDALAGNIYDIVYESVEGNGVWGAQVFKRNITDIAGNSLFEDSLYSARQYTIDNTAPTIRLEKDHEIGSAYTSHPDRLLMPGDRFTITATFSDDHPMRYHPSQYPRIKIGSYVDTTMTIDSDSTYTTWYYEWLVPDALDIVEVEIVAFDSADNQATSPTGDVKYYIDNFQPFVSEVFPSHCDSVVRDADENLLHFVFTENYKVDSSEPPRITIRRVDDGFTLIDSVSLFALSSTEWAYLWDTPSQDSAVDGLYQIFLWGKDSAGNELTQLDIDNFYTLDNTFPEGIIDSVPKTDILTTETSLDTIYFNEPIFNFTIEDLTITNAIVRNFTSIKDSCAPSIDIFSCEPTNFWANNDCVYDQTFGFKIIKPFVGSRDTVTISVLAGASNDIAGNPNNQTNTVYLIFENPYWELIPDVTRVLQSSGVSGRRVQIEGDNLFAPKEDIVVYLGTTRMVIDTMYTTSGKDVIQALVPAGATDGAISVHRASRFSRYNSTFEVTPLFEQNLTFQQSSSFEFFNQIPIGSTGFSIGDLNNDGILELFIAGQEDSLRYYTSDTITQSLAEETSVYNPMLKLPIEHASTLEWIDLDFDGDQDALYILNESQIGMIENIGSSTVPVFEFRNDNDQNPFSSFRLSGLNDLAIIDLDQDHYLDVLLLTSNGAIQHFESIDSAKLTLEERKGLDNPFRDVDAIDASYLTLINLDSDGEIELILGTQDGKIRWIEQDELTKQCYEVASGWFQAIQYSTPINVLPLDWNEDGDMDLIIQSESGNYDLWTNETERRETEILQVRGVYSDSTFGIGAIVPIEVIFSTKVTVEGIPSLELATGALTNTAIYTSGTTTDTLLFEYQVDSGNYSTRLDYVSSESLEGGFILNDSDVLVNLSLPPLTSTNSLGQSNIRIDGTTPIPEFSIGNVFSFDNPIVVKLSFNEPITDLERDDLSIHPSNHSIDSIISKGDSIYFEVEIIPTKEDSISLSISRNAVVDSSGNWNQAIDSIILIYDVTPPAIDTFFIVDSTNNAPIDTPITESLTSEEYALIRFTEDINGFDSGTPKVINGTVDDVIILNENYEFLFPLSHNGGVLKALILGKDVTDRAGNTMLNSDTLVWNDKTPPIFIGEPFEIKDTNNNGEWSANLQLNEAGQIGWVTMKPDSIEISNILNVDSLINNPFYSTDTIAADSTEIISTTSYEIEVRSSLPLFDTTLVFLYAFDTSGNLGESILIGIIINNDLVVTKIGVKASSLLIYPNPTNGILSIRLEGQPLRGNLSLFDLHGRLVKEENLLLNTDDTASIDCHDLADGVYNIQINVDGKTYHEKLVIRR